MPVQLHHQLNTGSMLLSAIMLSLTAVLVPVLPAAADRAQSTGAVHLTTDATVYAEGDALQYCYQLPGAGQVTVTDLTPDHVETVLLAAADGGTGACQGATVTPPLGQECLRLDFLADDPGRTTPASTATVCFQTLPQGAIAQYTRGGTIVGLHDSLIVYDDGQAADRDTGGAYTVNLQVSPADLAVLQDAVARFASLSTTNSSPPTVADGGGMSLFFRGRGTATASSDDLQRLEGILDKYLYEGHSRGRS